MSTFILSGKIIRQFNRQPIPKLYIEAWDKSTERKEPLVSTITDNDGVFFLSLDENYIGEIYKDRYPDIFFKVYAGNTLLASTEASLLVNLRGNTTDLVIAVDYGAAAEPKQTAYSVKGQILQKNFLPAAGCEVELCDKGILNDAVLAKARTDEVGYFEARFTKEAIEKTGKQSPDLFLRISQGRDVRYTTAVKYNAAAITEFKEVIGGAPFPQESEFEMLNKKLGLLLRQVPVNEIRQDETKNPYKLLAQKTGNSEQQVQWMVMAQQVSAITQLPPAFCYALLRGQLANEHTTGASVLLGSDPAGIISLLQSLQKGENVGQPFFALAQQPEAIIKAISLLPDDAVPNAFDFAVREQIIPRQMLSQREELLKQWSAVVSRYRQKNRDEFEQLISDVKLDEGGKKLVKDLFETHNGDVHRLLQSLEKEPKGSEAAKELKTVVAINEVVNDPRAASTVRSKLKIRQPEDISRLAGLSEKDWQKLAGDDASRWTAERIKQLQAVLEKQYPTAAFAGKLKSDKKNGFLAKEPVLNFLDAYPGVEIHQTNFETFFKKNEKGIKAKFKEPEALKTELKKVQRIFRLAPNYETTKALLERNITSSQSIYNLGKKNFVAAVTDNITGEEANKIYKKAERSYAAALAITGELKSLQQGSALRVLPDVHDAYEAMALKDFPDLKTLFSGTESWECKECKNVYSPAAYLADLLKFLNKRGSTTPFQSVKKVLFKRRQDIGEIDLNCDNSNTAVPYIDLVCEILEDALSTTSVVLAPAIEPLLTEGQVHANVLAEFKAKNLELDQKAAVTLSNATTWFIRDELHTYKIAKSGGQLQASLVKQTHGTVAERKAIPEYINYTVYDTILKNEKHPFNLPFDLSWEETRAY